MTSVEIQPVQARKDQAANIARGEFARRRKRLGTLTPEQEANVERLLLSTAIKISESLQRVSNVLEGLQSRTQFQDP
jgi:hypothetical protein